MCVQYWPAAKGKVEVYDDITVTYTHEEQLANFVIRNFKIIKDGPVSGLISAHFINFLSIKKIIIIFLERKAGEVFATVSLHRMAFPYLRNQLLFNIANIIYSQL